VAASGWDYYMPYQEDRYAAFVTLRQLVFEAGEFFWAVSGKTASDDPDRPATEDELWAVEAVRLQGTHSILDMYKVLADDEAPNYGYLPYSYDTFEEYMALVKEHGNPEYGVIVPVGEAEAYATAGDTKLTRDHIEAILPLAKYPGIGRLAVLHDENGRPVELYFWGFSGD
jgi:hypothetical protein